MGRSKGRDWPAVELQVKRMHFDGNIPIWRIAVLLGIGKKTVQRMLDGSWKNPNIPVGTVEHPATVPPYICEGCKRRTGRLVKVVYSPCVICSAENLKRSMGVPA